MIKTIKAAVAALLLIPALLSCTKDQPVQPAHPQNITGSASGTLVGGNLMTFAPVVGSSADATLSFNIDGTQTPVSTGSAVTKSTPTSLQRRLFLSGKALVE